MMDWIGVMFISLYMIAFVVFIFWRDIEALRYGRWVVKTKDPHICHRPDEYAKPLGSVWQCRRCGLRWSTVVNSSYRIWRKVDGQ